MRDGQEVTLSCAEGDEGFAYDGLLDFAEEKVSLKKLPKTRTPIMLNIASPGGAFRWWKLPCDGIGLARIEFIIANRIQIHPMALVNFDELEDREARRRIEKLTTRTSAIISSTSSRKGSPVSLPPSIRVP